MPPYLRLGGLISSLALCRRQILIVCELLKLINDPGDRKSISYLSLHHKKRNRPDVTDSLEVNKSLSGMDSPAFCQFCQDADFTFSYINLFFTLIRIKVQYTPADLLAGIGIPSM